MTDVPQPQDTGSSGTQQAASPELSIVERGSPLHGLLITQTVEGLAATRSRSMGGEVAASLLAGSFSQLSFDLQATRNELKEVREDLSRKAEEFSDIKTKAAVLQERVTAHERDRHLRNLSIAVGTILIGVGIELFKNNFDKFGLIAGGMGVLLVFLGWFSKKEGAEK